MMPILMITLVVSDAGWLGLMIAEERVDMFAAVHNAMLQVLKVSTTNALSSSTHCSCKGLDMPSAGPSLLKHVSDIELLLCRMSTWTCCPTAATCASATIRRSPAR